MKRAKIGDVLEIPTRVGLAYAQYSHFHKNYGEVIRVFDYVAEQQPVDFDELVHSKVRFLTFFPVGPAVHRRIFEVVARCTVPDEALAFPLFRSGAVGKDGRVGDNWWLWDGEKEWRVGKLSKGQWKLPILEIWNDTVLIERIELQWTPDGREF